MESFIEASEQQAIFHSQACNFTVKCKAQLPFNATSSEYRRKKYQQRHLAEVPLNLKNEYPHLKLFYWTQHFHYH